MKTELKDPPVGTPGGECPKTLHLNGAVKERGKHNWDYFVSEALPPHVKEMRRCTRCGFMQAIPKVMTDGN